jgi:hypothetical protein
VRTAIVALLSTALGLILGRNGFNVSADLFWTIEAFFMAFYAVGAWHGAEAYGRKP